MTYMPPEGGRVTLWYVPGERGVLAMTGLTGPAAAGGDRIRASHAERDQVVETLKNAFVDGQLTKDEFDERAGQALTARTRSELAALTDDVPASPDAAPPASTALPAPPHRRPPVQAPRPLATAAAGSGACLVAAYGLVMFAANYLDPHGLGDPDHPWSALCGALAFVLLMTAVFITVNGVASSMEQRRLRRQLPPLPR
jgi:hypothetical protein